MTSALTLSGCVPLLKHLGHLDCLSLGAQKNGSPCQLPFRLSTSGDPDTQQMTCELEGQLASNSAPETTGAH